MVALKTEALVFVGPLQCEMMVNWLKVGIPMIGLTPSEVGGWVSANY